MLCAYLGQLAKVRDALHDLVAVVIDERDQTELADREEEEVEELRQESQVNHVKITSRVCDPASIYRFWTTMLILLGRFASARSTTIKGRKRRYLAHGP